MHSVDTEMNDLIVSQQSRLFSVALMLVPWLNYNTKHEKCLYRRLDTGWILPLRISLIGISEYGGLIIKYFILIYS